MKRRKIHGEEDNLPWLCCGDFNEILFNYEKEGGPPRVQRCMEDFRKALEDCDLHDLGFTGDPFTWRNNHHVAASYKRERLDRAVAISAWRNNFPLVKVIESVGFINLESLMGPLPSKSSARQTALRMTRNS